jgi:predicted small lipoprotein YifL
MRNNIKTAIAVMSIAAALTGCGTIKPPTIDTAVTTEPVTATEVTTAAATVPVTTEAPMSDEEKRQLEQTTFIAEFLNSQIKFEDTASITDEVIKKSDFECESAKNGTEKIIVKGKNGGGVIEVSVMDISASSLKNDIENVLCRYGDYSYEQIKGGMKGINAEDFNTNYRMITSVVTKGKFQRYGAIQKSDGMSAQFGYAETYAVLRDNKLTIISGQLLSTDMTERQNFSELIKQLAEKVEY